MEIIELQEGIYKPEFIYRDEDLGVNYSKEKTIVKLWAPTAENVRLEVYNHYEKEDPFEVFEMFEDLNGT